MTSTTAGGAARFWPRRRVLVMALVVSAVLNLFFLVGAAWTRLHAPAETSPDDRYAQMAAELNLDPRQKAGFERYVAAMRARNEKMRQEIAPLIGAAWDETAKPQADVAQIMQRYDQASDKWREFQHESTVQTLDFLSLLSPEQRAKFVAIARARRAPWLRRHQGKH